MSQPAPTSRADHALYTGHTWHVRHLPSGHKFTYPYRMWGLNLNRLNALTSSRWLSIGSGVAEPDGQVGSADAGDASGTKSTMKSTATKKPLVEKIKTALCQIRASDHDYLYTQAEIAESAVKQGATDNQDATLKNVLEPAQVNLTVDKSQHANESQGLNQNLSQNAELGENKSLAAAVKQHMQRLTGKAVAGDVLAVTNARTLGFYFSPVNFFIGYDGAHQPSHLLAEVSNTPWGETHLYGFLLNGERTKYSHDKAFKVSPFNDMTGEQYHWQVEVKPDALRINIGLTDARGKVFDAGIHLSASPLTQAHIKREILKNPMMNATSIARIYWQAFKLYFMKKLPYVAYDKSDK